MKKYIYIVLIGVLCYFIGESIYVEMTKDSTPGKAKRLECQKKVTTFERVFDKEEIINFQETIKSGSINFTSDIEKAKYSKSTLFESVSLENIDVILKDSLLEYKVTNSENVTSNYKIHYYIYENDKDDPGKKSKKSKNYAGYVVFEIKNISNKLIYKIQIDFMDHKGSDIDQSIRCIVKSVMSIQ